LVATIETAFLYRDEFVDIDKTFEYAQDWWFNIQLAAAAVNVAALEAKEWFDLDIEFHLDSEYSFKSESMYSSTSTTGRVLVKSASGQLVHIANVGFKSGISAKDPVIEYLHGHEAVSNSLLFDHDGHS
ncbi:hypothetical protein GGI00_006440, partial [Coemansia sp. RSA 2681]